MSDAARSDRQWAIMFLATLREPAYRAHDEALLVAKLTEARLDAARACREAAEKALVLASNGMVTPEYVRARLPAESPSSGNATNNEGE